MEAIGVIKEKLAAIPAEELPALVSEYRDDTREGVKKLVAAADKRIAAYQAELQRMHEMYHYERL